MIRSFLAIDFPKREKEIVAGYMEALRGIPSGIKWVSSYQIHLTLKFFGAITQETIEKISSTVSPFSLGFERFALTLKGIGAFPNLYRPRVIWMGFGGDTEILKELHEKIDQALMPLGIAKEERVFKPHLTLGRNKANELNELLVQRLTQWSEKETQPFPVEALTLYRSDLKPTGAIYTPLAEFPFRKK
jgi:RNA 2',3'-cyclic 3'-phosphodiesterase